VVIVVLFVVGTKQIAKEICWFREHMLDNLIILTIMTNLII